MKTVINNIDEVNLNIKKALSSVDVTPLQRYYQNSNGTFVGEKIQPSKMSLNIKRDLVYVLKKQIPISEVNNNRQKIINKTKSFSNSRIFHEGKCINIKIQSIHQV